MESVAKVTLLNADGRPLDSRIQSALRELLPRFRHRFLTLRDDLLVTEIFEDAGRRIVEHEAEFGPAENLGGYAWRILHNSAVTRLRHSAMRLDRAMLAPSESQVAINSLSSREGTARQIEANIELQHFLSRLTPQERRICTRKQAGYSSREIADELGTTPGYVDKVFSRIRRKCHEARAHGSPRTSAGSRRRGRSNMLPSE